MITIEKYVLSDGECFAVTFLVKLSIFLSANGPFSGLGVGSPGGLGLPWSSHELPVTP